MLPRRRPTTEVSLLFRCGNLIFIYRLGVCVASNLADEGTQTKTDRGGCLGQAHQNLLRTFPLILAVLQKGNIFNRKPHARSFFFRFRTFLKYSKKILFNVLRSFFVLPTTRFLLLLRWSSEVFCDLLRTFLFSSKGTPSLPKTKCANNIQKNVIRRPLSANNLLAVPVRVAPVTVFVLVHFVLVRWPPSLLLASLPAEGEKARGREGGPLQKGELLKSLKRTSRRPISPRTGWRGLVF